MLVFLCLVVCELCVCFNCVFEYVVGYFEVMWWVCVVCCVQCDVGVALLICAWFVCLCGGFYEFVYVCIEIHSVLG